MADEPKPPISPEVKERKARVSLDDPQVVDELCHRIAEGKGIWEVCDSSEDMPHTSTVYRRMGSDEVFATRIARAREAQQDARSDLMSKIAREATAETWQVARLQIWTEQWVAAKLAAKKYGTQKHEHSGPDGGPIPARLEGLSESQLDQLAKRLGVAGNPSPEGGGGPGDREKEG
jgi:hypothetical protein